MTKTTATKAPPAIAAPTPGPHGPRLHKAIDDHNSAEIREFEQATNTRFVGHKGDIFTVAETLVRALFVGDDKHPWIDGALLAESMNHGEPLTEAYHQALCDPELPIRDLIIWTDTRGSWNGLVGPIGVIAQQLQLPVPVRALNAPWARGWQDFPNRTDRQELALIAAGGKPLATYRGSADW